MFGRDEDGSGGMELCQQDVDEGLNVLFNLLNATLGFLPLDTIQSQVVLNIS